MSAERAWTPAEHKEWRRKRSLSEAQIYRHMRFALRRIAREGCSRLVDPHTCRGANGYPEAEWCEGCIAAEGLGLPRDWFVIKR